MAFVTPIIPLHLKSSTQAKEFAQVSRATRPTHKSTTRRVRPTASSDSYQTYDISTVRPTPVSVKRTSTREDLDIVYRVWNEIASTEGKPHVKPDDNDSAADTVHLIARAHDTGAPVGAARLLRVEQNARLDRVTVLPGWRGQGVGRLLVEKLLTFATAVPGAIYVNARRGTDMGFFSIVGFESVGNDRLEDGHIVRTMMYRFPMCAPSTGCVGLHHTSIRVSDIERSLAFYGSVGFFITEKFVTSGGHRACFVEGLGTRLEFVEVIDGNGALSGMQGIPPAGFDRLVFDVTKACTDLDVYLQHLERKNGGALEIAGPPSKQVVGAYVMSVASISDPDGLPIEFFRREARVPGELRTAVKW